MEEMGKRHKAEPAIFKAKTMELSLSLKWHVRFGDRLGDDDAAREKPLLGSVTRFWMTMNLKPHHNNTTFMHWQSALRQVSSELEP